MLFTVTHQDKKRYHWSSFDNTDELYIFCLGVEMDIETKLETDIDTFVDFVMQCFEEDCRNAPLKSLVTFIADRWNEFQIRDTRFIINKFYEIKNQ